VYLESKTPVNCTEHSITVRRIQQAYEINQYQNVARYFYIPFHHDSQGRTNQIDDDFVDVMTVCYKDNCLMSYKSFLSTDAQLDSLKTILNLR